MPHSDIVEAIEHNRINVISGDGSQVVQLVAYIATLPPAKREAIKITKVLYTSEPLARTQRAFIKSVLGPVAICSVLGSAEAGPWAVANLDLTGDVEDDYMEFIFDTRTIVIEILPLSVEDPDNAANGTDASTVPAELPQGEIGIVVQTSLQRLRNPLVRYLSGDLGSLHPLPASALANVPTEDAQHLKLLRLYGRDRRFSFKWYGEYFVFDKIEALMRTEELGIMQWQIVLSYMESTPEIAIEIRVFRPMPDDGDRRVIAADELVETLKKTFGFLPSNAHLFRVTFVRSHEEFERSKTGNKVIKLVDRTKKK